MSNPYPNSTGRAEDTNQAAAHDAGLYDPNVHDNQIVAVYDTVAQACVARDALLATGIPKAAIHVVDHTAGDASGQSSAEDRNQGGFWGAIKSLFAPEEDVSAYNHAIGRGHAMLVLTPNASMDRHRAIQILESSHPIDFDAKLEEWRQAGYAQMPNAGGSYFQGAPPEKYHTEQIGGPGIRSYLARREARPGGPGMGTGGAVTNATPGATSSGTNSPRGE